MEDGLLQGQFWRGAPRPSTTGREVDGIHMHLPCGRSTAARSVTAQPAEPGTRSRAGGWRAWLPAAGSKVTGCLCGRQGQRCSPWPASGRWHGRSGRTFTVHTNVPFCQPQKERALTPASRHASHSTR